MARFTNAWPSLLSAALLLLAFPPFNLGFLVFVALAPWLLSLSVCNGNQAFKSGYAFGLLFMGGQFVWLFQFVERWTKSPAMGLIPAVACMIVGALYFGLAGWLIAIAWRRKWVWAIPILWVGVEVFRTFIPGLAFPWGLVHTPLYPYAAIIQLAHFGTAFLVSAWVVVANLVACLMMAKADRSFVRAFVLVFLLGGLLSWVRYSTPMEGKGVRVMVAQPGIDLAFGDPNLEADRIKAALDDVFRLADANPMIQLIVLPEGLIDNQGHWPPLLQAKMPIHAGVVLGGQRSQAGTTFQSAYGYDGSWSFADKRRLVIFGEYVPLRKQLPFLQGFDLPSGDLTPAEHTSVMTVRNWKIGPMLCFEGLFPDVARDQALNGAQLLTTMSVDDWYMNSPAPDQLMAGSVFRAVETGLPLARSASTGISMAVDPRGNILRMAPIGGRQIIDQEFVLPSTPDYIPVSWYAVWLFFASLFAIPIWDWILRRREASKPTE